MPGSYRASVGHNPKILVKKAGLRLSGGPVTYAIAPIPSTGGFKWYPGHYFGLGTQIEPGKEAEIDTLFNQISGIPVANCPGVRLGIIWGQLEPHAKGVYNWTALDARIANCAAQGRKAMLAIVFQEFRSYTAKTITGAANNGSGLIRITSAGHGFSNNQRVSITGVGGVAGATGNRKISGVTTNTFDLVGSSFSGSYSSGGVAAFAGPATPQADNAGLEISDYIVDAGLAYTSATILSPRMWETACMTHFMDFLAAVAARYDNDSRVSFVNSEEVSFSLPLDGSISSTSLANALQPEVTRLVNFAPTIFTKTPYVLYNNFGGRDQNGPVTQLAIDIGVGIGVPDIQGRDTADPVIGGPNQYNFRYAFGQRWNGSAWILNSSDQRPNALCSCEKQVNRRMTWTPQTVVTEALFAYTPHVIVWNPQTTAYLYQHSGDPAYRIPAMDKANLIAYLTAGPAALRADKPAAF